MAEVERLVLGTMNFKWFTSERDAFRILDSAFDAGIRMIDTANVYGWREGGGAVEELIGRWLRARPSHRNLVQVATKAYRALDDWPNHGGLSAAGLEYAVDRSCAALGVSTIDILRCHHIDRSVSAAETVAALGSLMARKKIAAWGYSNFAGWHLVMFEATARRLGVPGGGSEQSIFNLLQQDARRDVLPACAALGLNFLAWSPLYRGVLAGGSSNARRSDVRSQNVRHKFGNQLAAFTALCQQLAVRPSAVALGWVARQPGVTGVVVGPRTVTQLEQLLEARSLRLLESDWQAIDDLFAPTWESAQSTLHSGFNTSLPM
jgi:NDP-hexose 2,3-enoyl reductase